MEHSKLIVSTNQSLNTKILKTMKEKTCLSYDKFQHTVAFCDNELITFNFRKSSSDSKRWHYDEKYPDKIVHHLYVCCLFAESMNLDLYGQNILSENELNILNNLDFPC